MTFASRLDVNSMTTTLAALISASHFLRTSSLASGSPAFAKARLAFPSWPRVNWACAGCSFVSAASGTPLTASFGDRGDNSIVLVFRRHSFQCFELSINASGVFREVGLSARFLFLGVH